MKVEAEQKPVMIVHYFAVVQEAAARLPFSSSPASIVVIFSLCASYLISCVSCIRVYIQVNND